jgi:hypothetical protein
VIPGVLVELVLPSEAILAEEMVVLLAAMAVMVEAEEVPVATLEMVEKVDALPAYGLQQMAQVVPVAAEMAPVIILEAGSALMAKGPVDLRDLLPTLAEKEDQVEPMHRMVLIVQEIFLEVLMEVAEATLILVEMEL